MPRPAIAAQSDKALNCYHQKLSWKIKKVDWSSDESLYLKLKTKIPGSSSIVPQVLGLTNPHLGGCASISRQRKSIGFLTQWPNVVDLNKLSMEAFFTIKLDDGSSVSIHCDKIKRIVHEDINWNQVNVSKKVALDPELLYDDEGCFIIEAELKVTQEEPNNEENSRKSDFAKDMGGIFSDMKTSDVVVVAGAEKFHCHKNILSARCEVFKNMLAPNTIESESSTIEVKEVPAVAVESMLKYIYTGEVPDDPEKLTLDLLNLADMYLLDHLKENCLKSLMERLDVVSCISTFIMVADRYMQSVGNLKEMVMKFMKCKAEEVVELEDWDKFVDNHAALAKEVLRSMVKGVKEKHKCQFCVISYGE